MPQCKPLLTSYHYLFYSFTALFCHQHPVQWHSGGSICQFLAAQALKLTSTSGSRLYFGIFCFCKNSCKSLVKHRQQGRTGRSHFRSKNGDCRIAVDRWEAAIYLIYLICIHVVYCINCINVHPIWEAYASGMTLGKNPKKGRPRGGSLRAGNTRDRPASFGPSILFKPSIC